ncbi:D-alanyl-D-alanine carboxypeptidase [Streptomyces sp. NPDC054757]
MAGESPDKSEQRKSSEGTAPGTSDPRLAVFRSVPDPEAGAVSGSQSGDARLREAVAAWVAGADDPADASGPSGASDGGDTPEASETRVMPTPSVDGPEAGSARSEAGTDASAAGADAEPDEGARGAQAASGAASAADAPAGAPSDAEARTGASGGADGPAGPGDDAATDGEAGDTPGGTGASGGAAAADAGTGAPDAKQAGDARSGEAAGAGTAASVAEAAAAGQGAKPGTGPGAKPEAEPDAPSNVADAKAAAKADEKPVGKDGAQGGKAAPNGGEKTTPRVDEKAATKPGGEAAAKADSKADPNGDGDGGAGSEPEGEAVDQPTGIFRIPSRPVDQPTTTLKRSTFVPLRPDDVPGERKKPTPAPVPSPAKAPAGVPAASAAAGAAGGADTAQPPLVEPTRQQPLPPKPPLDLLAELTNKPAPPETPVRTAVRRFKIWTPLVLLVLIIFAVVQAVRPLPDPGLKLTAAPSYSFSGSKVALPWPGEGQGMMSVAGLGTMDSFGAEKPVPIASMAKSMTAYLIMQDHPMKPGAKGASIPVDATAEKEGHYDKSGNESTLNTIKKGDVLSEKDALSAVMIPSANNVARLLARWDAGSEAAFVKKMNDTARKLGMTHTKYTDPSGLTASTVSTAADQVKLGQELVKMPALMDITKLPSWTDPSGKAWSNYNRLVPYNGVIGIKTGSTTTAGGSLLFAAEQKVGHTTQYIVGAVLGQHQGPSIIDTVNAVSKKALLPAESALTSQNVVKKGQVVGYVDDGLGGQTPVVATKDFEAAGWAGLKVDIKIGDGGKAIPHEAKAGTVVGQLTVGSGPGKVTAPVALQKDLPKPGFGAKLTRVG